MKWETNIEGLLAAHFERWHTCLRRRCPILALSHKEYGYIQYVCAKKIAEIFKWFRPFHQSAQGSICLIRCKKCMNKKSML
mmetsp:Transcript_29490/g.43898  ORF Transcript_29490/g.43898 Transcript_29490/m.43898 type:complete len:81 (-) Transcript_29490:284-526(-)